MIENLTACQFIIRIECQILKFEEMFLYNNNNDDFINNTFKQRGIRVCITKFNSYSKFEIVIRRIYDEKNSRFICDSNEFKNVVSKNRCKKTIETKCFVCMFFL